MSSTAGAEIDPTSAAVRPPSLQLALRRSNHLARYATSADGQQAVFSVPVYTAPTATPGYTEGDYPRFVNAIYTISPAHSLPIRVGTIRGTIEDILWLPDSSGAIVRMAGRLSPPPIDSWLVRLSTSSIEPFLGEGVIVYGVSAEAPFVLYRHSDQMYVYDLVDSQSVPIPGLSGLLYFWWLGDNTRLLYLAGGEYPELVDAPYVFYIDTGEVAGPVGQSVSVYPWYFPSAVMSPAESMIAYSQHPTQALHIVTLCVDGYGAGHEDQ
jgi:hypothetical protein